MAPSARIDIARGLRTLALLGGILVLYLTASSLFHRLKLRMDVQTDRRIGLPTPVRSKTLPTTSMCESLDGYDVVDKSPIRSPLLVADHLIEHSRGKVIFEIGTRNGDILDCVSRFTKAAYSVEIKKEYCDALRVRGLTVLCDDVLKIKLADLPEFPDVFFWWPMDAQAQNEAWLEHVRQQVTAAALDKRVAMIGFDNKWQKDIDSKLQMFKRYPNAKEYTLEFAEGSEWRAHGVFSVVHFPLS